MGTHLLHTYERALRGLVLALAGLSGAAVLGMVALTTVDVVLRTAMNRPVAGTYDVVKLLGAVAIAGALPYTTAVKGHVAVEYFFLKLGQQSRIAVDTVNRALCIGLLALLTQRVWQLGDSLRASGEVTPTLQLPVYPALYAIALCCIVAALVVVQHLLFPSRVVLKP